MKIAFLILAHKNPQQLKRLISSLDAPYFDFYIHIDNRVEVNAFKAIIGASHSNIHFVKNRSRGSWGGLGIVQGTINSVEEIIASGELYSHVSLISGQDYPIQSNKKIHAFFNENQGKSYIEYESFPVKHMKFGGMERIEHYSFDLFGKRHTYLPYKYCKNLSLKGKLLNSLLLATQIVLPKRKIPNNLKPYYGSQWWSLNFSALKSIMAYLKHNPNYIQYHKFSLLPDEMFFQTILMNSEFKHGVINDNKRFILWSTESSHPISLSSLHLERIKTSNKLFARKFEENEEVLNQIDQLKIT